MSFEKYMWRAKPIIIDSVELAASHCKTFAILIRWYALMNFLSFIISTKREVISKKKN